ncbi:bacterial regulatory s, gntR family protein [Burkholderia ambifaria AMMD]|uniref:Transcriptional regulator, GntR family n=1 Tax=Burkholderia ambifaria (strain ATCC BAA-244 / DSM 16087 / CCUG 44356 / LMG 19182 / AMMD) TaxID=339670 RepID=Q0B7L1_BURCM|nr:GntR family transcriptional regulator [Burkholderia ambifaria]ABI89862.1 transcriptional regulator, GntR family [Burkholderia ambifaria AMMD]AJY25796.1 bacterial regulatory s, gntR family protein [Burkholderia ambifaria AMMD]UEP37368.1 GntR family transcriptional regulator [Burkholderia ambifaria]UZU03425.1 GntR family transcriptional regulator [Burkholderia ambifaria]UZU09977.1 GntR family transcriptional regulator [Burkholderia ambifaria]
MSRPSEQPFPVTVPAANGMASNITLATSLYDRLRTDLLAGKLEPGRKLQIEFLCEQYQAGQTPVREALNRLTSDGLVERRDQRGFAVTDISADDLREITRTRILLEEVALREAFAANQPEWEEELVLAYHRLSKVPRSLNETEYLENPEWERLHRAFHRALISGCRSRWLMGFCEQLADQLYRYRQLSVRRIYPNRHEKEEHKAMLDAVVARDSLRAIELLKTHYQQTAEIILTDTTLFPRNE